jgi:hypothetical protein
LLVSNGEGFHQNHRAFQFLHARGETKSDLAGRRLVRLATIDELVGHDGQNRKGPRSRQLFAAVLNQLWAKKPSEVWNGGIQLSRSPYL